MSENNPEDPPPASSEVRAFTSVWVKVEKVHEESDSTDDSSKQLQNTKTTKKKKKATLIPNSIKCTKCNYRTSKKTCLQSHMLVHSDTKPLACPHCDYKTRYSISLKRHIFVKHEAKESETIQQDLPTFKCTLCSYTTQFNWNLNAHLRKHSLKKQYKCSHCSYSTAYKHNHEKHSRIHRDDPEMTYCCDKCPFKTKFEGHIVRHLAKVHLEISEKARRCDKCSFTTKTGWRLNIHKNRSQQEQPINCVHCDYQTLYRCAFKEHRLTHYNGKISEQQFSAFWLDTLLKDKTLPTDVEDIKESQAEINEQADEIMKMCKIRSKIATDTDMELKDTSQIYNELKSKMADDSYYTCNEVPLANQLNTQQSEYEKKNHYFVDPACQAEFSNVQVTESPEPYRPFQCITCNFRSKFKACVQKHYQRHHTSHIRPYKCINCDFATKTKEQIALHNKRSKSNEVLICNTCSFSTAFKCQYAMHEKVHFPFKCVICSYACRKKYDIQKHFTLVHLGNSLKCSYCDFTAKRKESLLCHEASHTGKKPFQCELCPYSSVRRSLLQNHMNRFHKSQMQEKVLDESKIEMLKMKVTELNVLENVDFCYNEDVCY